MSLIIPDGFGQATLVFDFITGPSNPMNIVIGYENANDQSPFANATIINDEYESNVLVNSVISNNVMLLATEVLQNPGSASSEVSSGVTGNITLDSLPPQVAYLIHKETALGGRQHRGRIYQPGATVGNVLEGGTLHTAAITALNVGFTGWRVNLSSNSIPMVVLHSSVGTTPTEVEALQADAICATQRRRLRG